MKKFNLSVTAMALVVLASTAYATPIRFNGYDAGSSSLATSPRATTAAADFDAAAGLLEISDFETAPTAFSMTNSSILSATPGGCSAALCGYNTTVGGSNYAAGPNVFGSITFTFAKAISAFGAYLTGFQLPGQSVTYTYSDGTSGVFTIANARPTGGTRFFGFYETGRTFQSVTFNTCVSQTTCDYIGFDDVRTSAPSAVPLPAGLPMLASALGGLAFLRRRNKRQA